MTEIIELLLSYRFVTTTEETLQMAIAHVLESHEVGFVREHRLTRRDRIDFYLPPARVGIEVKVEGSTNAVARQIARYCESDQIDGVIVVTNRVKHRNVPAELGGKPVRVVFTGRGAL